jgi:cyclic beta-1,2-glucan synthetase
MSLLPSPVFDRNVRYSAELTGAYCRIDAKSGFVRSSVTVSVPENEAGELRTVEIISSVAREAELLCYFEPVLSRLSDYESHPAFSKLSLETLVYDSSVIVKRRPRAKGRGIAMAFDSNCPFTFDTSREKALGRGGIFALRRSLHREASSSVGSVLDPCVLSRVTVHLEPDIPFRVSFSLTTSSTPQAASAAAKRILSVSGPPAYSRLDESAHRLKLTPEQLESAMALLPGLIYPSPDRFIPDGLKASLRHGQKSLWSLGISGDLPILSALIENEDDIASASELIPMHRLLSENGVTFDLVYLLKGGGDYRNTLRDSLLSVLRAYGFEDRLSGRGGIHLADSASQGSETVRAVSSWTVGPQEKPPRFERSEHSQPSAHPFHSPCSEQELRYSYNSDNSFTFEICGTLPYNAWSHMLSNASFGYLATDAGTGHMWHLNARENKINHWLNDSLATIGTERLEYCANGVKFSLFAAADGFPCTVTYGFGWAEWKKAIDGRTFTTKAFVPSDISARILIIETDDSEDFEISYFTDLVLSPNTDNSVYVTTERRENLISARNPYNTDFPDTVFFLTSSVPEAAFTCSKMSWLSGNFDGMTGAGFTPCAAALYKANRALVLVTGCDQPDVLQTLSSPERASDKLRETIGWWKQLTSKLTVKTHSDNLNRYLNGWALYQTMAGRLFGRTSLYQSGGAYGFRDQLQDVCAIVDEAPQLVREHLMRAAAHQFEEGDVQHWWHPVDQTGDLGDKGGGLGDKGGGLGDKGVRTRCSDDLLWLPYALCIYVEKTGDTIILNTEAPYIRSEPLSEDEDERYEQPKISTLSESLLSHAIKAVDLVIQRGTGRHGLCFIGSGDWNDGMNLVGAGGEGESVWLTWFLCVTAEKMAAICLNAGNPGAASRFSEAAKQAKHAAEVSWDGDWYRRGYYDDGAPLGSCISDECRLDSIAQSFAALAGADDKKTHTALTTSVSRLYDKDERVVRLFDPPFSDGSSIPGYIKGYSPGFRENGGQYTHGAVWLAMGLFLSGMTDAGWEILEALLPQGRPNDVYRTEPYVIAADVYSAAGHIGRGGWTWYTGAAGWFRRVALENLLGLQLRDGCLTIDPVLPSFWEGYEADWTDSGQTYHIRVGKAGDVSVTVNGIPAEDDKKIVITRKTPV